LDAIVFTAGVGENDYLTRKLVCEDMSFLGIHLDESKNEAHEKGISAIQKSNAQVKIFIIPTNEELEIARQCFELLG
jgi:acetate kinase